MALSIDILKRLQAVDAELFELRKRQHAKPRELQQVQAQVAAQAQRCQAAADRVKALQMAHKEKDMELQSREGQVKKLQGQLFQLKTNKEYAAMQREIDGLKADNSLLEEDILVTLDSIDQATKDRQREQERLDNEQEHLSGEQRRIDGELAAIAGRIGELERDRQTILPDVPAKMLETYERILRLREGLALVPLINDACGGCHRRMPPQVVNEVYLQAALVTCENCSRILYFDEAHSKL